MSAAPAKTADPSMEEILASIRRIIADDDDKAPAPDAKAAEPAAKTAAPPEEPAESAPPEAPSASFAVDDAQDDEDSEVLDLTPFEERLKSDTSLDLDLPDLSFQVSPLAEDHESASERPIMPEKSEIAQAAEAAPMQMAVGAPEPRASAPNPPSEQLAPARPEPTVEEPVPPEPALRTSEGMLSQENSASVGQAFNLLSHTIMSQNQHTLEDLVREMLKPMLKTWLDDNLPPLVERLVTAEIQRVARGQR